MKRPPAGGGAGSIDRPSPPWDRSAPMRVRLAALALVLVATAVAYLPAIDGAFVLDDLDLLSSPLVMDPLARGPAEWLGVRPVVTFTFALNQLAVGLDPRGWHLTNLAIHLAGVVLAWRFARLVLARAGLAEPEGPALAAAGLFALHPMQTEAVAYVTQRAESLAAALYLAALLVLARRDAAEGRRRHALLAAALGIHVLGLGVKPILVTLPAAWLLLAAALPAPSETARPAWRRAWARVPAALPFLALSVASALATARGAEGSMHTGFSIPGLPASSYAATQLRVIPTYLRLLLWPSGQSAEWDFPASAGFLEPAALGGAALLAVGVAAAAWAAVRLRAAPGDGPAAARAAAFGLLFFLLVLAPTSSVVPLKDVLAERRVYLPSLGLFAGAAAAAAAALRAWAGARARLAGMALAAVILAAAGVATARRSAVWATELAFWTDAAEKAPRKARVQLNLGHALHGANRTAEALQAFYRARDLRADHTVDGEVLFQDIVSTLIALTRVGEARAEVERVLAAFPRDPLALALLATVEYVSGRDLECERAALLALAQDPWHPVALRALGMSRLRRGEVASAREVLRAAASTNAVDPTIFSELGQAEERMGNLGAACAAYGRAAALPGNSWASAAARLSRGRLRCP